MNRFACVCLGVLFASSSALGQFTKGTVETSFSGSAGSLTTKHTYSSGSFSYESSESRMWGMASAIVGYYFVDGFSIEPEISMLGFEKEKPAWYLLANLSYTFPLPGDRTGLFARAGYGVSNSLKTPLYSDMPSRESDKMDIGVINIGVGVKHFVASHVALRGEVNWRRQSHKTDSGSGPTATSSEYAYTSIAVLAGIMLSL